MSKKKDSVLKKEFEIFKNGLHDDKVDIEGALAKGIPVEIIDRILNDMTDFSKYAFNKSHAACYAVIAYQTAFLATYYPLEFFASYLTSFIEDNKQLKKHCYGVRKKAGIRLMPSDINESETNFVVMDDKIMFGLGALSGVGISTTTKIVEERNANGKFKSLYDFISRIGGDKKLLEALIKSGTMDSISEGHNRNEMLHVYESYISYANNERQSSMSGQYSLFDFLGEEAKTSAIPKYPELPDLDENTKLEYEKEVAYMYLSSHPLRQYESWTKGLKLDEVSDIITSVEEDDGRYTNGQSVMCSVIISDISKKLTKNNQNIWFFQASDEGEDIGVVGFNRFVNQYGFMLNNDCCCILKGKLEQRDEDTWQIIGEQIIAFPSNPQEADVFMKLTKQTDKPQQKYHQEQKNIIQEPTQRKYRHGLHVLVESWDYANKKILPMLEQMPGNYPVFLYFKSVKDGEVKAAEYQRGVNIEHPLIKELVNKLGIQNVKWES